MDKNQKGFTLFEILLVLLVIGLVGFIGIYVWVHHYRSQFQPVGTTPSSSVTPVNRSNWLTYRSTHSSIQFSYPSSWKFTKINPSTQPSYDLESVVLVGPNDFTMNFDLEQNHVNSGAACGIFGGTTGTPVVLSNRYSIVPEVLYNKFYDLYLFSPSITSSELQNPCGLGWVNNPVEATMEFTFNGIYHQPSAAPPGAMAQNGNGVVQKPLKNYINLPEVQTAKAIFSSFKQ